MVARLCSSIMVPRSVHPADSLQAIAGAAREAQRRRSSGRLPGFRRSDGVMSI